MAHNHALTGRAWRSDYSFAVPKKVRQMALRTVLSAKLGEGNVVLLESATLPDAKTKTLMAGAAPRPEPSRKRQRPRADAAPSAFYDLLTPN